MARAATIPVGALEAGDLMDENPRGKKARDVEHMEQTPDQKAEKIVEKTIVTFALALAFLARFAFQQTSNSVGHCHLPPIPTVS